MRFAPSNLPAPRSPESAVSHVPPSTPPVYRMGFLPRTPAQYDIGEPATTIGPMMIRADRGRHHGLPTGLAIGDDDRLALGVWMARATSSINSRFCAADVLDRLTRHRLGREADEVAGMAGADRDSDLAVRLHAPDARPMTGARVDDDDRRFRGIDDRAFGRNDADKPIVDRARQLAPVKDELGSAKFSTFGYFLRRLREMDVPALVQSLEGQEAPLPRVRSNTPSLGRAS